MKYFYSLLVIAILVSCNKQSEKSRIEDILASNDFKYWIVVPKTSEESVLIRIIYFDRDHFSLALFYSTKMNKILEPEFDDVFYDPYWEVVNDSIVNIGGLNYKINVLTKDSMLLVSNSNIINLHSVPMDLIPIGQQKRMTMPEILRTMSRIKYD